MATDTQNPRLPLTPDVAGLLQALRGRIRAYVWIEGIALLVAAAGAAFWITLLMDQPWALELPRGARMAVLGLATAAGLYLIYRFILRRAFVHLGNRSMALLLERRFSRLGDSLLTAVELSDHNAQLDGVSPEMLAHTYGEAQASVGEIQLSQVFDYRPLGRAMLAAVVLAGSVAAYAALQPNYFGIWLRRNILLSEELWPRYTRLLVEGFDEHGRAKIARGADFPIVVKADTAKQIPEQVQIRYRYDEGARGSEIMVQDGIAQPGVDPFQQFSYSFQGVLSPIRLDVLGGDDRKNNLRIEVVDSPTVTEMTLLVTYPAYMRRAQRSLPVTGVMQLPEGTVAVLHAKTNKDIVQVDVQAPPDEEAAATAVTTLHPSETSDARAFEFSLGELRADRTLLFSLLDLDGIRNREPIRLSIGISPDKVPQVAVQLRGIGSAITPMARLPAGGVMTDDYGIDAAWFEYVVDESEPGRLPLTAAPRGRDDIAFGDAGDEALDVRDQLVDGEGQRLTLQPGQKLQVAVRAEDAYSLGAAPHVGSSQRFLLDVVTPDQLRTLLESRELNLRQRFEIILDEVTESSDMLIRLDFSPAAPAEKPADDAPESADPTDDDVAPPANSAELTALRVERTLQNSRKNAQETVGVAASFEEITAELVNNRVDTEELKLRLTEGISRPLRHIGEEMFPELERRLEILKKATEEAPQNAARASARQQADAILAEMRQVLAKMVELETFNEALAMLRSIIESQDKINGLTEELRKQKAKALLDD
ncbi:MAG: hypothetical protein AB7O62_15665 [Pirellulales bacterium]